MLRTEPKVLCKLYKYSTELHLQPQLLCVFLYFLSLLFFSTLTFVLVCSHIYHQLTYSPGFRVSLQLLIMCLSPKIKSYFKSLFYIAQLPWLSLLNALSSLLTYFKVLPRFFNLCRGSSFILLSFPHISDWPLLLGLLSFLLSCCPQFIHQQFSKILRTS